MGRMPTERERVGSYKQSWLSRLILKKNHLTARKPHVRPHHTVTPAL